MKHIIWIGVLAVASAVLFWLIIQFRNDAISVLTIGKATVQLEVADEPLERERGLSGRDGLAKSSGMLFVFEEPDYHGIWMKDMQFAIDIVWISEDRIVVDIKKNAAPETYPEVFLPEAPALYVLEVPAGFAAEHQLGIGETAEF